ncbi:MAG: hypothetical protein ABIV50_08485, partial [Opitutus sp.]
QKYAAVLIENENVNRAMQPSARVDLTPERHAHGFIAIVNNIKKFVSNWVHAAPLHWRSFVSIRGS